MAQAAADERSWDTAALPGWGNSVPSAAGCWCAGLPEIDQRAHLQAEGPGQCTQRLLPLAAFPSSSVQCPSAGCCRRRRAAWRCCTASPTSPPGALGQGLLAAGRTEACSTLSSAPSHPSQPSNTIFSDICSFSSLPAHQVLHRECGDRAHHPQRHSLALLPPAVHCDAQHRAQGGALAGRGLGRGSGARLLGQERVAGLAGRFCLQQC